MWNYYQTILLVHVLVVLPTHTIILYLIINLPATGDNSSCQIPLVYDLLVIGSGAGKSFLVPSSVHMLQSSFSFSNVRHQASYGILPKPLLPRHVKGIRAEASDRLTPSLNPN